MKNRRKTKRWRLKRQASVFVSLSALALVSFLVNQGTVYAAGETDWLNVSVDSVTINTSPFKGGKFNSEIKFSQTLDDTTKTPTETKFAVVVEEVSSQGVTEAFRQTFDSKDANKDNTIKAELKTTATSLGEKVTYRVFFDKVDPGSTLGVHSKDLTSYGYTSSEEKLTSDNPTRTSVAQTYTPSGKPTEERTETWTVSNFNHNFKVKSGYGVPLNVTLTGSTNAQSLTQPKPIIQVRSDKKTLSRNSVIPYTTDSDGAAYIDLEETSADNYVFPQVYSIIGSGDTILASSRGSIPARDGGRKFYLPLFTPPGKQLFSYTTREPLGANRFSMDAGEIVDVYGQLETTFDSYTVKFDELHLVPVLPDSMTSDTYWSSDDVSWVREAIKSDWGGSKYVRKDGNWAKEG